MRALLAMRARRTTRRRGAVGVGLARRRRGAGRTRLVMRIAAAPGALQGFVETLRARRALGEPVEADQHPAAAEGDEAHAHGLAGAPAHSVAGRNVEMHAP